MIMLIIGIGVGALLGIWTIAIIQSGSRKPVGAWLIGDHKNIICSNCGYSEDRWWADKGTNYCPHCGALMEKSL